MKPFVELISTGSELLSGRTVNRHAQSLGAALAPLGLKLSRDTTIPDDAGILGAAVLDALTRVDVVVVSGGLGPTVDDLTCDAISRALRRDVVMDERSVGMVKARFEARGRVATEAALRQARTVKGAAILDNPVGVAPAQRIELGEQVLFLLPGPPGEFDAVLEQHIVPWLAVAFAEQPVSCEHLFLISGLGESDIGTRFEEAGLPPKGIDVAYCAAPSRVEVRLSAPVPCETMDLAVEQVREVLGTHIYAEEREEVHAVVARLLMEARKDVAVAESCTGGMLAQYLTSGSGSSLFFAGGVVAYSNASKARDLGVSEDDLDAYGAVSEPVAYQLATGVRDRFGTAFGMGITGIAGPTGGTDEKPVGLVYISLADPERVWVHQHRFSGGRERVRASSCIAALHLLRRRLLGQLEAPGERES